MGPIYYIGLDVHKRKISYCVKDSSGRINSEGWIPATRCDLDRTREASPRQLPTDHDYAVSTREYQSDQPSQ